MEQMEQFEKIITEIQTINSRQLEMKLDQMIFDLYELTQEERKEMLY